MRLLAACLLALVAFPTAAQPLGTISTVAGGGVGDGGPALSATLKAPLGVALGAGGVTYVADSGQGRVRKIAADGTITTLFTGSQAVVGTTFPFYQNGPASCPTDILVAPSGDVVFSDPCSHVVRKVDTSGAASVVAGRGTHTTPFDDPLNEGPATAASLVFPTHIALDAAGNLYITEPFRYRIRRVSSDGVIHHFAGATSSSESAPQPGALAIDAGGSLHAYIAGPGTVNGNRIRKYASDGTSTVIAGTGATTDSGDGGPAASAGLSTVLGMAFDAAGNLVLAMTDRIRHITAGGTIEAVASVGGPDVAPVGIDYLVPSADRLLRLTAPSTATPVAGLPPGVAPSSGDGGPATAGRLEGPRAVVVDAAGVMYIAESLRHRIRKVDASGTITTLAGTGVAGYGGDGGPASAAQLSSPTGLALDAGGNLYVADRGNHRVRRIDLGGVITSVAGDGTPGFGGDGGPATAAQLSLPSAVSIDDAGNLLIADYDNERIRRVTPAGGINTLGGGGNQPIYRGMPATPAESVFIEPKAVRAHDGNVYLSQWSGDYDSEVARIGADGMIGVVADYNDYVSDAPMFSGRFRAMADVELGPAGSLIVADPVMRRVAQRATAFGYFRIVAGGGTCGTACGNDGIGDGGAAAAAILSAPSGLFFHAASGSLYIADEGHNRIRKVVLAEPMPAAFSIPEATDAPLSTAVVSPPVTPTGYLGPASISVVAGEYSIGCTGIFTAAAGSISPGEAVCVRRVSATSYNTRTGMTLKIGGRVAEFFVTTMTGPGSASLSDLSIAFPEQLVNTASAPITVTVTNTGANEIGLYSWVSSPGITVTRECDPIIAAGATCQLTVVLTPPAAGDYAGNVTLRLSIGFVSFTVTGSGTRSLATHFYRSILDREPEPEGIVFWDGEAARALSLGADPREAWYAMAATFFSSPEYVSFNRTDDGFVSNLYRTFFDRLPDAGGLEYWKGQLAAGLPRETLVTGFTFSPEFTNFTRAIFGEVSVRPEVTLVMDLYRGFLSRLPDNEGLAFWADRLRAVQCSTATWPAKLDLMRAEVEAMTKGFLDSAEYANRNRSDAQFLADTYAALFRRAADKAGFDYWQARLAAGESRNQVRAAMIGMTNEFLIRAQGVAGWTCLQ